LRCLLKRFLASGLVERIGQENSMLHYKSGDVKFSEEFSIQDHSVALKKVTNYLLDPDMGVIKDASEIPAIGHRVVHGGDAFSATIEITEDVKTEIKKLFSLAPLHNPPNLKGIQVAEDIFPNASQVAVFDTAFHRSIPDCANTYAIPLSFKKDHNIQVYGFHGTSHKYVTEQAVKILDKKIQRS
jgi:acetate kinase